jgi:hypothetical protein
LHQGKEMNNQPIMQCQKSLQCFSALIIRKNELFIIKIPVVPKLYFKIVDFLFTHFLTLVVLVAKENKAHG